MTKISVVIPAKGRERLLQAAIQSLLVQTRKPDEIVVIDDGSEPPISTASCSGLVSLVRIPENSGSGAARNFGVSVASGDLVAFLDSDDCLHPRTLELYLHAYAETGARLIYCHAHSVRMRRIVGGSSLPMDQNPARALALRNFIHTCSAVCIDRALFLRGGGFDPTLRIGQDFDFFLRLCCSSTLLICRIPYFLVERRLGVGNATGDVGESVHSLAGIHFKMMGDSDLRCIRQELAIGLERRLRRIANQARSCKDKQIIENALTHAIETRRVIELESRVAFPPGYATAFCECPSSDQVFAAHSASGEQPLRILLNLGSPPISSPRFCRLYRRHTGLGLQLGRLSASLLCVPMSISPDSDERAALSAVALGHDRPFPLLCGVPSKDELSRLVKQADLIITGNEALAAISLAQSKPLIYRMGNGWEVTNLRMPRLRRWISDVIQWLNEYGV